MALNAETIKSNEGLKDLTEDQIATIETLSTNDETAVIGKRIGKLHEQYDKDIFEITGVEKTNDTEKSYEYNKRVLSDYKTKAENSSTLVDEITNLKKTISKQEEAISKGNTDAVLAQKLKDSNSKLETLQDELDNTKKTLTKKETEYLTQVQNMKVDSVIQLVKKDLKFKTEYEGMSSKLFDTAKREVLERVTPDFVEEESKSVLVLRDKDGEILRTKNNGMKPTTINELIKAELKEALTDKETTGTGTKKPSSSNDKVNLLDLSSANNQVDADDIIAEHLMKKGLVRGSREFVTEQTKIRKDNKVETLPVK